MAKKWVYVVDEQGNLLSQEMPPFQPFTSAGKTITVKGRPCTVTAVEGDLENGNATITVVSLSSSRASETAV